MSSGHLRGWLPNRGKNNRKTLIATLITGHQIRMTVTEWLLNRVWLHLLRMVCLSYWQNIWFFVDEEEDSNNDKAENIKPLNAKLDDLQTCNDLVGKHGSALQRSIVELQEVEDNPTLFAKLKFVNEKATLFRITANAMISVSETSHFFGPKAYSFDCFFFSSRWRLSVLSLSLE